MIFYSRELDSKQGTAKDSNNATCSPDEALRGRTRALSDPGSPTGDSQIQ